MSLKVREQHAQFDAAVAGGQLEESESLGKSNSYETVLVGKVVSFTRNADLTSDFVFRTHWTCREYVLRVPSSWLYSDNERKLIESMVGRDKLEARSNAIILVLAPDDTLMLVEDEL